MIVKYRKPLAAGVAGTLVLIAVAWFLFYPYRYVLSFQEPSTGKVIAYLPVSETDHFQIKFIHSVHLSEVVEEYQIKEERIYPVQLVYEDTSIGMPADAGDGETFEMKNGKYYISNLQGFHDKINLKVGQVRANHTIVYEQQDYLLKNYVGAGRVVTISAVHQSNWKLWEGVKLRE